MTKGGVRDGAGRPVIGRQLNITLSYDDIDTAKALGNGNVSLGVRIALAWAREREPSQPEQEVERDN
jgi:hypothetical protein